MQLENIKFGYLGDYIKGIIKAYQGKVEYNNKLITGYKKRLVENIVKKKFYGSNIDHNTKNHKNFADIIRTLFKNVEIEKYYTEKGLRKIICNEVAKRIVETKKIELDNKDKSLIVDNIKKNIISLREQIYAFQVLHLRYTGEDIRISSCKLVTFDEKVKALKTPFYDFIPKPNIKYRNFIIVNIFGNDSTKDHKRAWELARNFIALLKLQFTKSPLVELSDSYLKPYKKNWAIGYKRNGVLHWDLEIDDKKKLECVKLFRNHLDNIFENNLHESLSLSLQRFSNAQKIPNSAYKLAEIIGCIETLLTTREDAKKTDVNMTTRLYNRIISFRGDVFNKEVLKRLLEEYYEKRSEYTHQSTIGELEKEIINIIRIYQIIVEIYSKEMCKYKSKKELIQKLDKIIKKNKKNNKN